MMLALAANSTAAADSELCSALREFANSATYDKPVRIALVADWQDFSKRCEYSENSEASHLCKVLFPKLHRSFIHTAARETVACFPDLQAYALGPQGGLDRAEIRLHSRALPGSHQNIHVSVSYLVGSDVDGQWLTVVAEADPE
ncbi:MAG: hypothetical protein R3F15_20635 [Lysobacterales bacterium]